MNEQPERSIIRKDLDYHHTLMEGMFLTFKEAAEDGLLAQYEDLIDSLYFSIPTRKKVNVKVLDDRGKEEMKAIEAWGLATMIKPPERNKDGKELSQGDKDMDISHKLRALRKTQILIDIEHALGFLMDEPPIGRLHQDTSYYKRMDESDE